MKQRLIFLTVGAGALVTGLAIDAGLAFLVLWYAEIVR
jgi:hypothetical protein